MQKKRKEKGIEKKDFRHLRRFELIEIISRLLKGQTDGEKKESEIPIEEVEQERIRLKYRRNYWRVFRSTIYGLIVVAALSVLISTLLLPLQKVSGSSMEPTLNNGDYVFVVKNADLVKDVEDFKEYGAHGLVKNGTSLQVIVGLSVPQVRTKFEDLLKTED